MLMNAKNIHLLMKSTINRWFTINMVKFSICQYSNTAVYCDPVMGNLGLIYKLASPYIESFSFMGFSERND